MPGIKALFTTPFLSQRVALYGFIRRRDGLKVRPRGVDCASCTTLEAGPDALAVISPIRTRAFKPNPQDLIRHEEAVSEIFDRQVILPAKFPKILAVDALEHSIFGMRKELSEVLHRIVYKTEYQVRVFMTQPVMREESPSYFLNAFSKFVMENSSRYEYRHFFPVLTKEGKEAEFVDYAETVVRNISQRLCEYTAYWRGKTFKSERVLLDSFFWVRRHRAADFENNFARLRKFYPNLRFSIIGPNPPYNFVQLEFVKTI